MRAPFAHRKIALLTAAVMASAGASTLMFSGINPEFTGRVADVLGIMHSRSPGARPAGAVSNKHPRPKVHKVLARAPVHHKKRISHVLPVAVAAPTPVEAAPAIVAAATPIPAAITPLAAPAALLPAATHSGFFIPPFFIPPGGGGGGIIVTPPAAPPPGPPPVPGVPEPSTWAMMIFGFLFVGGLLRRRRRVEEAHSVPGETVASAS